MTSACVKFQGRDQVTSHHVQADPGQVWWTKAGRRKENRAIDPRLLNLTRCRVTESGIFCWFMVVHKTSSFSPNGRETSRKVIKTTTRTLNCQIRLSKTAFVPETNGLLLPQTTYKFVDKEIEVVLSFPMACFAAETWPIPSLDSSSVWQVFEAGCWTRASSKSNFALFLYCRHVLSIHSSE